MLFPLILFAGQPLPGQQAGDSLLLDRRVPFVEGIYLDWSSVRNNRPDYSWEDIDAVWIANAETRLARLVSLQWKDPGEARSVGEITAVARDSILYLRLEDDLAEGRATVFSGLWVQGRLCLHVYEKEVTRMVEIKAYNPQTGKPFRSAMMPTRQTEEVPVMIDFLTGRSCELNRGNLLGWIRSDARLLEQIASLPQDEVDLIRVLETYNRRNPVFIPKAREAGE